MILHLYCVIAPVRVRGAGLPEYASVATRRTGKRDTKPAYAVSTFHETHQLPLMSYLLPLYFPYSRHKALDQSKAE